MRLRERLPVFSAAAGIAYTLAYYFDWSLFRYYIMENRFHFAEQPDAAGPPILWYGWLATAVLTGAVAAAIVPPRLAARLPADLLWLMPVVLIVAALMYEKRWFM
jgi:hypothetical protein